MQKVSKCKILSVVAAAILLIQLGLGLYALWRKESIYRIRPRYLMEVELTGETYVHPKSPIDIKLRNVYIRRKDSNEAFKSHLVSRRDILGKNISGNEDFTDINGVDVSLNFNCNTCSIIGTSGTLLNSHNGNSIDKADCVFRLGSSPTSGFEANVGKKTTARIISSKKLAEFLKKPDKLVSGHLSVDTWIYYNLHDTVNIPWMLSKMRDIKRKYKKMSFLRFSRKGEHRALSSLKKFGEKSGYLLIGAAPSTLWYTVRIADIAKCSKLNIYGVPDPKYCKRHIESTVKARYWDIHSPQLCKYGIDFSSNATAESEVLSISDRRSLMGLAKMHNITFISPSWPL